MEDLFARYLIAKSQRNAKILINQPMSFKNRGGTLRIKPDLAVIVKSRASAFFDIKMDLGFKRNEFAAISRKRDKLILKLRGQPFVTRQGLSKTAEPLSYRVGRRLKYHVVVVSGENIDRRRLRSIKVEFKKLRASRLYILTEDVHPNDYGSPSIAQTLGRIRIRHADFEHLLGAVGRQ